MQWLRLYDDVLDDPKVQRLPPLLFKHWINVLCLANEGKVRGRIPYHPDDIGFRLRLDPDKVKDLVDSLTNAGLLELEGDNLVPHGWDERQFASDDAGSYVRKWRAKQKDAPKDSDEILHVRPPEQIQSQIQSRTETPHTPQRGEYTDEFERFWTKYPKVVNSSKKKAAVSWGRLKPETRVLAMAGLDKYLASDGWQRGFAPHATTYLNGALWESDPPPARMNGHSPPRPEDRRPAIPSLEQVLQPPKHLSDEKRAELAAMFEARRQR